MPRQNVYTYTADGTAELDGYFDPDVADQYPEETRWDGNNKVSVNAAPYGHEHLYRTKGGRWVKNFWSQWDGTPETFEFIDDAAARDWLLHNEYDTADVEALFGALDDERGPAGGRPAIGPQIKTRYSQDTLDQIDVKAESAGMNRAEWLRHAAESALTANPVTVELTAINQERGRTWYDTVTVFRDGDEVDTVDVESSEDPEPYDRALIEAGWLNFTWATQ